MAVIGYQRNAMFLFVQVGFWHASEDAHVKSPSQLFDLYCKSVGRGASFLLNVPPNRKGQIDTPDVASLKGFGDVMRQTFKVNLAQRAKVIASNVRGHSKAYSGQNLLSSNNEKFWATDDSVTNPSVEIDLGLPKTFDLIRLREPIQLGQRIESFDVDVFSDGIWSEIASSTTVGSCRIIRLDHPIKTSKVRIRVTHSPASVLLYDFGIYKMAKGAVK